MACGCRGGNGNNNTPQRVRANLQSPRKAFVPPNSQVDNPNFAPPLLGIPTPKANPQPPVSAADRRRIQRLNQEAIRRSLNR